MKNKTVPHYILSIVYGIFSLALLSSSAQLRAETINSYDEFTIFNEYADTYLDGVKSVVGVRYWGPTARSGSLSYATLSGYAEFDIFSRSPRESIFITFTIEEINLYGRPGSQLEEANNIDLGVNFYDPLSLSTSDNYILTAGSPRELQFGSISLFKNNPKIYKETLKIGDTVSIDITKEFNLAVEKKLFDLGVRFQFSSYDKVYTLGNIRLTDNDLPSEN